MAREMALAAYRHVLRSAALAFKGDANTLAAARHQARVNFEANRSLTPGSPEHQKTIEHAEGVAQILRENVVQGQRSKESEPYKLNIHEHIERGDNETIKTAGKKLREGLGSARRGRNTLTGNQNSSV